MASDGEIEELHRALAHRIADLTAMNVAMRGPAEDWTRVVRGSSVSFEMTSADYTTVAERKRGGRCLVFPLNRHELSEDQPWAGWYEEWYCLGRGDFDLIGLGWTFFWGVDGRLGREQEIFRAEWDQIRERDDQRHRRGVLAAQPHWHLDTAIMAGYSRPVIREPPAIRSTELEEVPSDAGPALVEVASPAGIQELDVSGMHLGMGGWRNHDGHPRCWQVQFGERWSEVIVGWAERTLQSARDQFSEVRVAQVVA